MLSSTKTRVFMLAVGLFLSIASISHAQETDKVFMPIGGGYADTYDGFIAEAVKHTSGDVVNILVMPVAYATSADTITDEERQTNISDAEERHTQIVDACNADVPAGKTCNVVLAPMFTRSDALDENSTSYFKDRLSAVYFLGGDQDVAMQVIMNTPVEEALQKAYESGTIIAGTSAGLSLQNKPMIGGYIGDFGPESGLNKDSVDLWNSAEKRGLSFGISSVILEQHFWERARISRLLNTLVQPDVPQVGVGIDTYTAAIITNETNLGNVFGLYEAAILDAETYGAAKNASFKNDILDIHNVLFHQLAPGDFSYDLTTRQPLMADVPASITRGENPFKVPEGAGTLMLAGNLGSILDSKPAALTRFLELSGGSSATILVVATGYATDEEAQSAIVAYGTALGTQTVGLILKPDSTAEIPPNSTGYGGVIITASDQSTIQPELLTPVLTAWRTGKPLLLDNAAAAIAGQYYAANAPIAEDDTDTVQNAFLQGETTLAEGLNILPITVEPSVMSNYRFGRLVSLAYAHPDLLTVGLPDNAALEISQTGAKVIGTNGVYVLDFHAATLDLGTNKGYVFANALLDVFAPDEAIELTTAGS